MVPKKWNEIYYFNYNYANKKVKNSIINLDNANYEHTVQIKNQSWYTAELDLNKYSAKTEHIKVKDNTIVDCYRFQSISYPIDVEDYGKYIIAITMKCDAPLLAQVPFSIFIDQDNLSTLTSK